MCSTLGYNNIFNQELPSKSNPAKCLMTQVLNDISNTSRILYLPYTNYTKKYKKVANGQRVSVLGVRSCGILKKVYYVPKLSHLSTWYFAFGYRSAERTRKLCSCYNIADVRKLEAKRFVFL